MARGINWAEVKRDYDRWPQQTTEKLADLLEARAIQPSDYSIAGAFQALQPNGPELYRALSYRKSAYLNSRDVALLEATNAVNSGDFAAITGQIVYNTVKEGYEYADVVWPELCTNYPTEFINGERIPGIGEIGSQSIEVVAEGEEFPIVGVNQDWTDAGPTQKRGFIVQVTREMTILDQTGLLLERCGNGGRFMTINKDVRVIDNAVGTINNYNRNGVATSTYLTAGAYINQQTPLTLANWQSVQQLELLFAGITDPNTGDPIIIKPDVLLVPLALLRQADFLLSAMNTAEVDNTPTANTIRTFGVNPISKGFWGQTRYKVVSNSYVQRRIVTNPTSAWFLGDFKKAIKYREIWAMETTQQAPNSPQEFYRDVMMGWKVSENGNPQVVEARYMARAN